MMAVPKPADMTGTYACAYDAWNRLVKVSDGAATVAEYRYDGLGRLIRKFVPDGGNWTVTEYYYSAGWQVLEVRRDGGITRSGSPLSEPALATTLREQYAWSPRYIDSPILRDQDAASGGDLGKSGSGLDERLYYLTDAQMNVTALVDTGGDAVERYTYDAYGSVTIYNPGWTGTQSAATYSNEVLYCGYRFDAETRFYHVRNRMYHPLLGRWLQRDPLGYVDGMSLYEYCRSGPGGATDPMGEGALDAAWRLATNPMETFYLQDLALRAAFGDAEDARVLEQHVTQLGDPGRPNVANVDALAPGVAQGGANIGRAAQEMVVDTVNGIANEALNMVPGVGAYNMAAKASQDLADLTGADSIRLPSASVTLLEAGDDWSKGISGSESELGHAISKGSARVGLEALKMAAIIKAVAAIGAKTEKTPCPGAGQGAPKGVGKLGSDPAKAPPGTEWRGKPGSTPGSVEGNYYNPKTGESYHPDLSHPDPIGPHWDYRAPDGKWYRVLPDGTMQPK